MLYTFIIYVDLKRLLSLESASKRQASFDWYCNEHGLCLHLLHIIVFVTTKKFFNLVFTLNYKSLSSVITIVDK